jgi:hypothetical protein
MTTRPDTDRGTYDPGVQATPPQKASLVEDFIDIFYTPSSVFARREKSGFGIPLLIVSVITALFAFASRSVFSQIFDAEFARGTAKAMAQNPRLTPEMMERMRPIQESIAQVFIYVGTPLFILFLALVIWLVAKVVSAKISYKQAAVITTFAWIPRLVGGLLGVLQVLLLDTTNVTNMYSLSYSPARFMDPDATNAKLFGILGGLDVFSIWFTVLVAIGIAVMGKVPRSKGFIAAAIVFVLSLVPALFR